MVTSSARRTPSLFTSSSSAVAEVGAAVIAFLLLTSMGQMNCSPTQFHHRNSSTIDLPPHQQPLPSASSHSASVGENLHPVLQRWRVRRGSGSGGGSNTPAAEIECYSCTYLLEEGYTEGEECNDPFNKATVPRLMCQGSCNKLKKKLLHGGVMVVRGCSKTCEEKVDEHGYRHCCTSKLCNSSFSLNSVENAVKIICSTVLSLFLATRLNSFA